MTAFLQGPAVRVTPNDHAEFAWIADVAWRGRVEVFDNADGAGVPVLIQDNVDAGGLPVEDTDHVVSLNIGAAVHVDTAYFFRVTMNDPTGTFPPLVPPTPLPPFFSGVQAIGDVFVDADTDSAVVSWTANVIGLGRVTYGLGAPDALGPIGDPDNIPDHSIELTGLTPGTLYQFRVANVHAIDQDVLAEALGTFTTEAAVPAGRVYLTRPTARPRVIRPGQQTLLSVLVRRRGQPVPGVVVRFAVVNGTASGEATSDAAGKASIWMYGRRPGLLRVRASSPDAANRLVIPVVVRRC